MTRKKADMALQLSPASGSSWLYHKLIFITGCLSPCISTLATSKWQGTFMRHAQEGSGHSGGIAAGLGDGTPWPVVTLYLSPLTSSRATEDRPQCSWSSEEIQQKDIWPIVWKKHVFRQKARINYGLTGICELLYIRRSYKTPAKELNESPRMTFVWFTDGDGWKMQVS